MEKTKISAVIITFNEASFIERCISSLEGVADEIVVVDSFSNDATEMICRRLNTRFIRHKFEGYVEQKNYALSMAVYPYVLSLDGDEALSEELKKSILKIKDNPDSDGYYFNRLNNFCGKWMRHSIWYPDRRLRLFNASKGRWVGPNPHDRFMLNPGSRTKKLNGDLLHWTYNSIEEFYAKSKTFSDISAKAYFKNGKKASVFSPAIHFFWRFFLMYILHLGFLDGREGWIVCLHGAKSTYRKYSTLRMLWKNEENQKHE
ncbi:MAG: glycosyltransferase family 2 protein [Bacteroidales bacterium]